MTEFRYSDSKPLKVLFFFSGGFSFADDLDAGKGWAGVVQFNERIRDESQLSLRETTPSPLVYATDVR